MAPPRQRARTPKTPTNEQLAQNLQHLTQTMQTLSEALLHNNHPAPPPQPAGHRDVGRLVSGHRPLMFAGEEDPVVLEEWVRTFDKIFSVVGCPEEHRVELALLYFSHEADLWWVHEGPACLEEPDFDWTALKDRMRERFYPTHVRAAMYEEFLHLQQGSSTVVEYHKRFLELARFARMLVPTELAKVEKFVANLNYEARKALTVSKPKTLKEVYLSAADLYRVQQLQRGSFELARKRTESGGSSHFKKPRQDFRAKTAPPPPQGPTRVEPGSQAKTFACRKCGKEHAGKDCSGYALRCFKCGKRWHKVAVCPQQANQRALRPSSGPNGASGGSSSQGAAGARPSGRVFVMGRSQAETEGLVEDEMAANPFS
ncbi:PREDICTED: uncharacterized protein LOC109163592 [Ipomoea nil]|uniref:uncharacterized protein LOC109163592 n=1 Tax=Ipomoea nil TaxID=35883 RepID=UPI000901C5A6|nr:PREDICTED: uncharacterized protein LOC109163592 [Ipomoea nil]